MAMRVHDTLTRRLRSVEPLEAGHVRLYTCGPTVWNRAHIGNFRTFLFEDVLRRWLERRFDRVSHVMNLTDVDDRLIRNAGEHGHSLDAETAPWIAGFFEDVDTLGIRRAHHYPRATRYVDQMVSLVERLESAGVTYSSGGSVYFRISSFPRYGALSGISAEGLVAGASGRVDADDYTKEDARDFALWKAVAPGDIGWDTRLGRGRPGWHIECSAMSMALLGESFDIHCGGVDNIFPHHENEIAQSEAATGKPFVRIWCHGEHLSIGGEKMAKRLGNFRTLPELVGAGYRPSAIRYFLIAGAHYRRKLDWDEEPLQAASEAVQRLSDFRDRLRGLAGAEAGAGGASTAGPAGAGAEVEAGAGGECTGGPAGAVSGMPRSGAPSSGASLSGVPRSGFSGYGGVPGPGGEGLAQTSAIVPRADEAATAFAAAMDDDLNVPEAVGHVFAAIRELNRLLDAGRPAPAEVERLALWVAQVDDVLGVLPLADRERAVGPSAEEQDLLDRRAAARDGRDFAESDRLRAELARRGLIVEDTPRGQRWRRA